MAEQVTFPEGLSGEEIGEVIGFFAVPSAGIVEIKKGSLKIGDKIWIRGHTTDLVETVTSMEVNHQKVERARAGEEVAVQVQARVRRHDKVVKVVP